MEGKESWALSRNREDVRMTLSWWEFWKGRVRE